MKIIFGRPYFYSVDFERIFYSDAMKSEGREYGTSYGYTIKTGGIYDKESGLVSGVEYLKGGQINDFFSNIGDLFKPGGSGTPGGGNNDFPSGHMNSCFTMIYIFYYFLGKTKIEKLILEN